MLSAEPTESGGRSATPLFGRHEIVEEIVRVLEDTRDGNGGRFLLLVGDGGVGKSTILRTIFPAATSLGYRILPGRSLPSEIPRPFGLVQDLLKAAQADSRERDSLPPELGTLPLFAAAYDRLAPDGLARATGLADSPREIDEADRLLAHLANPTERIDADRSSFFAQLASFFLQIAEDRPLLLALDDLPFADESSLEFLRRFAAHIGAARVFVLASCLPQTETPARSAPAMDRLSGLPNVGSAHVRPMTETELGEYVRWILNGRDPGRDAVMRWFSQTDGNPLFTEYLVRATTGFGTPPTAGEASSPDLGVLLKSRIERLPDAERRALVHAAVVGKEFDFGTLDAACGQEEERLSEHVDRLVHEGLLREKGNEVYEFVSERVRVDVYAQLTETRRRLLHRKVAQALLGRQGVTSTNLFELARQFYLGRDDVTATDLNRRAADAAARAYAFDTAVVHLDRAIECQRRIVPRDIPTEIRILVETGRYLDELGDLRRSEETLLDAVARARALPEAPTELALALLGLARTEGDLSLYVRSKDLATEAFGLLDRLGLPLGLLAAHRALGIAYWRMGDLAQAEEHQRAGLALAESDGTPAEHGHALIDLANTYTLGGPGRVEEAALLYERAAKIFEEIHDPSAQARVLMNRALLHHYAGRIEDSLTVMREALAAAERSRSPIWIGYCSINLAQFYAELGDVDHATPAIDRAAALLDPLGDHLARQQVEMIRGIIEETRENLGAASARYAHALELAQSLSLSAETAEMQFRIASLAFRQGDLVTSRRFLSDAQTAGIETLRGDLAPKVVELAARLPPSP